MTLREKQSLFLQNVAKLILWTFENGYELTGGELLRTNEQQLLYFEGYSVKKIDANLKLFKSQQKSKTMYGKHLEKLAIDLNLFVKGVYQTNKEGYKPVGDYWKTLNPLNVWGGDWTFNDSNHFEMK